MNERDIDRIAKNSAKKLNLPSRRRRILREYVEDVYSSTEFWYVYYVLYWYCRIMRKIVPKKYKSRFNTVKI